MIFNLIFHLKKVSMLFSYIMILILFQFVAIIKLYLVYTISQNSNFLRNIGLLRQSSFHKFSLFAKMSILCLSGARGGRRGISFSMWPSHRCNPMNKHLKQFFFFTNMSFSTVLSELCGNLRNKDAYCRWKLRPNFTHAKMFSKNLSGFLVNLLYLGNYWL